MLIYITLAAGLLQWYVAVRVTESISLLTGWKKIRIRISAVLVALWLIAYPSAMLCGYWFDLDGVNRNLQHSNALLDALITYPYWIGIILAFQLSMVLLAIDALRYILFPFYRKRRDRWAKAQAWFAVILFFGGILYSSLRVYLDTFTIRVRETQLQIDNLPAELDGFRILQIADLQADGRTNGSKLENYIAEVNRLDPDLIIFGGDLVTSGLDHIETGSQALGRLRARRGVYACLGDHDYFSNPALVTSSLERNGVTVLNNTATVIPVGSTFISITGLTNVYRTRPAQNTLQTIEQQRPRGPVNILLTHQPSPDIVAYATRNEYELLAAGHTHGGQIVFPLPGFLLTPSSFETDYVSGFYRVGPTMVSVTNGLGLTLAPVRYHAPSEITLITLKP
jgi:predicted MPP superfamily phosphohydrolase